MALVMDKVIEEILKYRKYKVWRCLDDNSLLALEKKDGDIATGRHPETQGLLPMEADMERGFFKVNEHFETSVPGIYAIGDIVCGGIQLAHAAEAEGKAAAAAIAGKKRAIDMAWCPSASTPFRKSQRLEFPKIRPKKTVFPSRQAGWSWAAMPKVSSPMKGDT